MGRILYRYLILEQLVPAFICFSGLLLILLAGRMMQLTTYLFSGSVTWLDLVRVIGLALPKMALYALPMATLIGILLGFLRLTADNELVAIRSAGVAFRQLWPAVATVVLLTTALSFYTSLSLVPTSTRQLKETLRTLSHAVVPALLKEGRFIDIVPDMVFFFDRVDPKTREIQGVFIHDTRNPQTRATIVAQSARLLDAKAHNALVFRIENGTISRVGNDLKASQTIRFGSYDLVLSLDELLNPGSAGKQDKGAMTMAQLRRAMQSSRGTPYTLEYHKRLALPFACLFLGFVAAPLGALFQSGHRMSGITLGIAIFLAYYVVLSAGKALGEEGILWPALGIWLPNLASASLAFYLWKKAQDETPFAVVSWWNKLQPVCARWLKTCSLPKKKSESPDHSAGK
ncbi:lipopolysaccharide export system permease protein [Desulfacinum hydrothermale DSM 13146]|uniref:Lipopolysaccharide export system permease protein n=1 Tax=Desulfacinum hydrothermale DSM 13146 TaxID=1121390 RepID=A0A1W1X4F5_9BACT|nr:LPS export ABC transporter permease LptF [Desulfacinum hydrothermale]SMC18782.1 lipopolysaccharide export system permease protein [Desulfacinum hydrothermale DSM 13146]